MTYPSSIRLMVGESEFDRWMFFPVSNKSFLWFTCVGLIGASGGYLASKALKYTNKKPWSRKF